MAKISLPPGFRFHPTDVELVKYYLKRKVLGKNFRFDAIADVDIYKYAPWDLPDKSCLRSRDLKWYFFCERGKKYSTGVRMNRATDFGYWKATGKDRNVDYNDEPVGMIKTLVFHRGKAPKGDRTDWVMHEYRLEDKGLADKGVVQEAYVLCVIFRKDGPGPRNGAQYGAPFREEDWSDDEEVDCGEATPSAGPSGLGFVLPNNQISSVATTTNLPEGIWIGTTSESCLSNTLPSSYNVLPPVSDVPMDAPQVQNNDVGLMLDCFKEVPLVSNENNSNERLDNFIQDGNVEVGSDGNDFFKDLEDLGTFGELSEGVYNFSCPDHTSFLELHDLDKPSPVVEHMQTDGPNVDYNCYNNSQQLSYPVNPCGATQHVFGLNHFSPMPPRGPHWFEDHGNVFHKGDGATGSLSHHEFELNQSPPMLPGGPHGFDDHVDVFHKGDVANESASQRMFELNQFPPMLPGGPHGFDGHVDVFHKGGGADGSASQHVFGFNQSPPMLPGVPHGFEDHVDVFPEGYDANGSVSQHVLGLNQSPPMLTGGPHGFEDHVDLFHMGDGADGSASQRVFRLNQSPPMLRGGPHGLEDHVDVFQMENGADGGASQHVFGFNQSPPMLPGGPHGFEDHVDVFLMENGANGGVSQHVFGLNQSPPMLPGGPHEFEDHVDVFHMGSGANGSVSQGYGNYEAALYNWDDTPFEQSVLGSSHASQDLGRGGFV